MFCTEIMVYVLYYTCNQLFFFIVLAHQNNIPRIDTLLHSDTLSRLSQPVFVLTP